MQLGDGAEDLSDERPRSESAASLPVPMHKPRVRFKPLPIRPAPDEMTQVVAGRVPSRRDSSNTPVVPVASLRREDGLPELAPAGPKDAIEEGKRGPKEKMQRRGHPDAA